MNLQNRIHILSRLGKYILDDSHAWKAVKQRAFQKNPWFIPGFIDHACTQIATQFLDEEKLVNWVKRYSVADEPDYPKKVGIVMAGNIPLVGFHDFLSVFIAGHDPVIKLSSKDDILLPFLTDCLKQWAPQLEKNITFANMLRGADAYIATGSDNTARYFEYYFSKHPSIIRRNRTSVAVIDGTESMAELEKLADDVHLYFGLGCRNVTKCYFPEAYDYLPLLEAFGKYGFFADHSKYRNNYDYNLAIQIMNNGYYMTNGSILLVESAQLFSPISQLNYEKNNNPHASLLQDAENIQCVVGHTGLGFGTTQQPGLGEYADGIDTLQFLQEL